MEQLEIYKRQRDELMKFLRHFCKNKDIRSRCGEIPCENCDVRKTIKLFEEAQ